jgi:hypothetical protein
LQSWKLQSSIGFNTTFRSLRVATVRCGREFFGNSLGVELVLIQELDDFAGTLLMAEVGLPEADIVGGQASVRGREVRGKFGFYLEHRVR